MFFNDAKIASRELELTLTGRDCGQEERAPMCGVPFHSAETYIARLVAKGKVAICEQMEDPRLQRASLKRKRVRVITPAPLWKAACSTRRRTTTSLPRIIRAIRWASALRIFQRASWRRRR